MIVQKPVKLREEQIVFQEFQEKKKDLDRIVEQNRKFKEEFLKKNKLSSEKDFLRFKRYTIQTQI